MTGVTLLDITRALSSAPVCFYCREAIDEDHDTDECAGEMGYIIEGEAEMRDGVGRAERRDAKRRPSMVQHSKNFAALVQRAVLKRLSGRK